MSPVVKENVRLLRSALLGAAALLLVTLLAGAWALVRWDSYQQAVRVAQLALTAAIQERRAAQADAKLLARVGADFQALETRGAVESVDSVGAVQSKFNRIDALDRFEAAARTQGGIERYALERAQPLPEGLVPHLQQLALVKHSLSFEAAPLHEEEFLGLWKRIDAGVGGLHAIEQCALQRVLDGAALEVTGSAVPRLRARCTLNWFVFSPASEVAQLNMQGGALQGGTP